MTNIESNQSRPLVTIGIPTYNRAGGYLRECIEGAINQTYLNFEFIISDNCSVDGTTTLASSIADSRIRYFRHPKNIGANNNFNYCLEQAKGARIKAWCEGSLYFKNQ
jgi:glycosyltransferase involved in cell wall biosynthesis